MSFDGRNTISMMCCRCRMTDDKQFSQFALRYGDVLLNEETRSPRTRRGGVRSIGEYSGPCAIQNQLSAVQRDRGISGCFSFAYVPLVSQQTGVFARRPALQRHHRAPWWEAICRTSFLALASERRRTARNRDGVERLDALLGGLDQLIAKKRDLKQAAMQQLPDRRDSPPRLPRRVGAEAVGGSRHVPAQWREFPR